ncbi:CapA family protein [Butyrivibrio sp. MB2005]|uniref:CapA family protein n=1 Tax=Butyrivibrio sp. MB2005 TaxID=1280678 RepID=UPI0003F537EF|nr:CapA family protein [Butyrivibrio sp. MB2005]
MKYIYDYVKEKINDSKGGVNSAVIAFVCAFLVTVTIGAGVLAVLHSRNIKEPAQDIADTEPSVTRVPYAEKIVTSDTDESQTGTDNVIVREDSAGTNEAGEADVENQEEEPEAVEVASLPEGNLEYNITSADEDYISFGFAGDILFDPGYAIMNRIRQNGGAISGVIGDSLLSYMRAADVMVVNNEFPYSNGGAPKEGKTFTFRADPSSVSLLGDMGVDLCTIANNHVFDYGESALLDTLTTIDNAGIARVGAGVNIEEASRPVYYTSQSGVRVAIIAATEIERLDNPDTRGATDTSPGVFRCLDITRLCSRIREAKEAGAFVIVCIHWGTENQEEIDWWQQKQSVEIVEAGADLIVGGHPHILQKIEYLNGVPVVYSLGNYLFNSKTLDTGLLSVKVHKDGACDLQFIPAVQSGCNVNEAAGADKDRILGHMRAISAGASIDENGIVSK